MFHICKSKSKTKPFSVIETAENGEVLSSHSLKTKQACLKNLVARMDNVFCDDDGPGKLYVDVQDETGRKPVLFILYDTFEKFGQSVTKPLYIAGKNNNKKKK